MVDIENQLLETRVKIVCKGGFVKFGILKKITDRYVTLQLLNGSVEIISFEGVDTIKKDDGAMR